MKKKIVLGIVAHVDAGKTTLSEAMLYESGSIRKLGRVDHGDAFLDTDAMERERGITIFSKQARFSYEDMEVALLDTPGHVDFSAEMERTLQVLDYGILVINGADGVQAHTRTLWKLLERYGVPAFLFVNKMDQPGTDSVALLKDLRENLDGGCIDFSDRTSEDFSENIAVCEEEVLEQFLQSGRVEDETIGRLVTERKVFPCFFGSALKLTGVKELLSGIRRFAKKPVYPTDFGARVFKITRDEQGNRLTWLKVTGGSLRVREEIAGEKVSQIRLYSGDKYETATEAEQGCVCAVTGPCETYPGEGLGAEPGAELPILEPVLTCRVVLPDDVDAAMMLPKLRLLEEEEPQLHLLWDERLKEIQIRIMGEVQLEVLGRLVSERFGVAVTFAQGSVVYKETIAEPVVGVGHFEPLRHYAEVHLLLEPGEPGSGITFAAACREEVLSRNWQRLIISQLEAKEHRGVLLGAPLTDIKITLLSGRSHIKHTEGGDFGQAAFRAVRQGLMEAGNVILEPYYAFRLTVPEKLLGRAMTDIERRHGSFELPQIENGTAVLTGTAPVASMRDYQKEVTAYTRGLGVLSCTLKGYLPCHNAEEVLEASSYDPESDLENPSGSVFCAHGAGFVVPWNQVKAYAHVEVETPDGPDSQGNSLRSREVETVGEGGLCGKCAQKDTKNLQDNPLSGIRASMQNPAPQKGDRALGTEEIDRILAQATHANKRAEDAPRKGIYRRKDKISVPAPSAVTYHPPAKQEEFLLVDGYNVIFAWEELKNIAEVSLDGARGKLLDILCDYQAFRGCRLMVVFDAYRIQGHATEIQDYHNIRVVYTKEAQTADQFIEKFAHENSGKYRMTVATSDGLEQIIIRGQGCSLLSSRDLLHEVERQKERLREEFLR